jgi:hypothetical protein
MALSAPDHLEEVYSMSIQLACHFDEAQLPAKLDDDIKRI